MLWCQLLLLLVSACLAQVSFPEVCPDLETKPNFEVSRYMGLWYEAEKYFFHHEAGGKCVKARYTLNDNGTVLVENSQLSSETGLISSIKGIAEPVGALDVAKLTVIFRFGAYERGAPYWVLDTDYDNWALVWNCKNDGNSSRRHCWILTRDPSPPTNVLDQVYDAVDKNNISRAYFIKTDQKNCSVSQ